MGGPCLLRPAAGAAVLGPPCTDNFQTTAFVVDGAEYQSVEQAYQALKFVNAAVQEKIRRLTKRSGENDSAFGLRCWQAAHSAGTAKKRGDHEAVKVDIMYRLMRAKYDQHPEQQQELLATGDVAIEGGPSTVWTSRRTKKHHRWQDWNGWIQMRIREELRSPGSALHCELEARFAEYLAEEGGPSAKWPLPGEGSAAPPAVAASSSADIAAAAAAAEEEAEQPGAEGQDEEEEEVAEALAALQREASEAALRCRDASALRAALRALLGEGLQDM